MKRTIKKFTFIMSLFLLLIVNYVIVIANEENVWTKISENNPGVGMHGLFEHDNKIYTGYNNFYCYDVEENSWSYSPYYQIYGGMLYSGAAIGDRIYYASVENLVYYDINEQEWYDVEGSEYLKVSWYDNVLRPWSPAHSQCVVIDEELYFIGGKGFDGGDNARIIQKYNLETNTWKKVTVMPNNQYAHDSTVEVLGNKIYIMGGYGKVHRVGVKPSSLTYNHTFYSYDINENSWSTLAIPKYDTKLATNCDIVQYQGKIYTTQKKLPAVYEYNPKNNTWIYAFDSIFESETSSGQTLYLTGKSMVEVNNQLYGLVYGGDLFVYGPKMEYSISYQANGGNGTVPVDDTLYEMNSVARIFGTNSLYKDGYIFIGWNTKTDGTGISYYEGDTISLMSNIILYAQWKLDETEIIPDTLNLSPISLELELGESYTINATVLPQNATNKTVKWKSSNPDVLTVYQGKITTKSVGTAIITATTESGNIKATCTITVKAKDIGERELILSETNLTMTAGTTHQLVATINPASDEVIKWNSSDSNVLTVNKGKVTARGIGEAMVTAFTEDGTLKAVCLILVE